MRPSSRHSLIVAALALAAATPRIACAGPEPERAVVAANIIVVGDLADEAHSALANGLSLLKRVFQRQGGDVVSHAISVGAREAALELEMAGGRTRAIAFRGGRLYVDGQAAGRYTPSAALEQGWRQLLSDGAGLGTPALVTSLRAFTLAGLTGEDAKVMERITGIARGLQVPPAAAARTRTEAQRVAAVAQAGADSTIRAQGGAIRFGDLERLDAVGHRLAALDEVGADIADAVRTSPMHLGDFTVAAGERVDGNVIVYQGDADVWGEVTGHVVALFGNVAVHSGATIGRNAVAIDGTVEDEGGTVRGDIKTVAAAELGDLDALHEGAKTADSPGAALDRVSNDAMNVVAMFAALAMLGFGTVFFGRRYIEVVADTASHSFGRALVVGLLGQLLVLPTFAMLIVGLVFTVVGILLLPFAAVAYVAAALLAVLGGYLAVAHAVGETFTRRRMAHGAFVRAPNAYGYLFTGLVGLLGLWALAALTGWLGPVAVLFKIAAAIVSWLAATVGFGAVLLSRGGLRETFAGRQFGEMSDEYLWATPPATPTAARMGMKD